MLNAPAQQHTISGYVRDAHSGEALIGANVYNLKTMMGTATNNYGFFSLTLPADSIWLTISFVGYQSHRMDFLLEGNQELNIDLSEGKLLEEVVVIGEELIEERTEMSLVRVPIKQVRSLPAILGETDLMKVLQLLPGVQSGMEGASGIYVRGGGPDQNLILLDGVPVYNAAHLFGAFSVFNTDAINNVELIKGGYPARYGGRLSSVIDISMKEGSKQGLKANGSIGLISSKLTVEGPIKDENTTFILSARRTYLDLLIRPLVRLASEGEATAGYYFYDLNFKINHRFSNKDRIYLSAYGGKDRAFAKSSYSYSNAGETYSSINKMGLDWGNVTSAARWNHVFTPKLFSNTTLVYSRYRFNVFYEFHEEMKSPNNSYKEDGFIKYFSGIEDYAFKSDFDFVPNANHYIRYGLHGTLHAFRPGVLSFKSIMDSDTTLGTPVTYAREFDLYVEDDFRITKKIKSNIGVHGSVFNVDGRNYFSVQPRVSMRYLMGDHLSMKASYAEMTQFIHLLTNSGIGLPTDLWVPATDIIRPQDSRQVALGLARSLNHDVEASVEGYYKTMNNLIEYKEGATFFHFDSNWENKVEAGRGWSYGAEVLLQKNKGPVTGWIGYTWSKTERQFENINFGEVFPYKYDRRHDFSMVAVYALSDRIELSGNFVYGTGNAVSIPVETYAGLADNPYWSPSIYYYVGRNAFRMRGYHRMDLGISIKKEKRWGERAWVLGIYNVYNRKNPFFIDIEWREDGQHFIQYSLFPIIPSFSYQFKFNKQ
ncbi:MAG: TonB-dependent receptor [Cyclobacteriaceae bacterium]|nr:TonB-dependent receptor [Cyclobacteriaceae bacterium]